MTVHAFCWRENICAFVNSDDKEYYNEYIEISLVCITNVETIQRHSNYSDYKS